MPLGITLILVVIALAVLAYYFIPRFRDWVDGKSTMIAATAVTVGGVLEASNLADIVPAGWEGRVYIGLGIIMAVLRLKTTGPVGKK